MVDSSCSKNNSASSNNQFNKKAEQIAKSLEMARAEKKRMCRKIYSEEARRFIFLLVKQYENYGAAARAFNAEGYTNSQGNPITRQNFRRLYLYHLQEIEKEKSRG